MQIESEYLSHQAVLVAAFADLRMGAVLELGCGFGSTPLLHALCASHDCSLTTLDADFGWLAQFGYLRRPWHRLAEVQDFASIPEYEQSWDIAVVDHSQAPLRGVSVLALRDQAEIVTQDMRTYAEAKLA
jgi:hypothetical protein